MLIDRCICFNIKFSEVLEIMKQNNFTTIEEVQKIRDVSSNCKLCRPYLERMIKTGETEFDYIIEKE